MRHEGPLKEVGVNVDVCSWLLGASRARGPLDRAASLARGAPTHRYARRDKSFGAVCRGVPGAGSRRSSAAAQRAGGLPPRSFVMQPMPSASRRTPKPLSRRGSEASASNKVALNATPLARDHGGMYSVESRGSDKATVSYRRCDFDGVRTLRAATRRAAW